MPLSQPDVDFFLNQARVKLPGASDSGIKTQLFSTIREFLKDTNSWIEHNRLLVTAGVQEYTITPKDSGQIIRLVGVRDGNKFPVLAAMPSIPTLTVYQGIAVSSIAVANNDTSTAANHPWYVCIVKNIALPQTREQLPIAPEFVLQRYGEFILDGVLGKMMMEQAKVYTNPQIAAYHLKRFRDGVNEARGEVWNQNLLGGQRWAFPQTFSTHSQRGGSVATWPAETF